MLLLTILVFFCAFVGSYRLQPGSKPIVASQSPLKPKFTPEPIDVQVYSNLYIYAHLIDIAYCVDKFHRIEEPFQCELDCASSFPNMTLVYQWFFDDSVCGYIATTYSNIFEYNDTETSNGERKKTVIVSLRGTRSLHDTLTDLKVEMVPFHNLGSALPWCGENCKIHKGFWAYFYRTMNVIGDLLLSELGDCENYELVLVGHSMGGSVALLLALHFLGLGYSQITLVTMGQPLMGNKDFTTWADYVLGSYLPLSHNTYNRKFIRVIHKGDIVTTIPRVGMRFYEKYHQFDNQIYIDTEASRTNPPPEKVVDCYNGENNECIAGDFQMMDQNYFEIHNTYFRRLGMCGIHLL